MVLASLVISQISKSSAIQRSGRAGRVRSGKAYRLFTGIKFILYASMFVEESAG